MGLSRAAEKALIDVGTNRQGARVDRRTPESALIELVNAGLIGPAYGLTRTGTIRRERLMNRLMDEMFPI